MIRILFVIGLTSLALGILGVIADTNWNLIYGKIRKFLRKLKKRLI